MRMRFVLLLVAAGFLGCVAETSTTRVRGPEPLPPRPASRPAPPADPAAQDAALAAADAGAEESLEPLAEPSGDPFAGFVTADAALASAVRRSEQSYLAARRAFLDRDIEEARTRFDESVDVLGAGEFAARPEAVALADAVTAQVAAFEAAWAEAQDEDPDEEPSALDALAGVDLPEVASAPEPAPPVASNSRIHGDVPIVVNNQVEAMLAIYKGRLKDEILPAFERSGRYLAMMQEIFREEGVPQDLVWLSLVESAFKEHAYSRAAAKGLWQFIRSTGRLYGLDSDYWVDERSDPVKATRAAARHLRDLHGTFGDWYLALAAYNAGAGKVSRAVQRVGRNDYWAIASSRHLMAETRNYVPAFLATLIIAEDPARHGFHYTPAPAWEYDEAEVAGPADLAVIAGAASAPLEDVRRLNPELRRPMTPGNRTSYRVRLPKGSRSAFLAAWNQLPAEQRLRFTTHEVGRGETLARIAARHGVRVDALVAANGLSSRRSVPVGTTLRVPLSDDYYPPSGWRETEKRSSSRRATVSYHRVRRGETASRIASRYGVSVSDLRRWNGLGRSGQLQAGSRLRVLGGKAKSSSGGSRGRVVQHRVRRGETLSTIAGRYGVKVQDLSRWNDMRPGANLIAGRRLTIHVSR